MTKDEALRIALEAMKIKQKVTMWANDGDRAKFNKAIKAVEAALLSRSDGEAKDEPVAWRDAAIRLGEELSSVGPDGYYDMDAKKWLDWAMKQNPRGEHSLPQRTWVGLDDEDYIKALELCDFDKDAAFDFFEAKLKEKNSYD